MTKSVPEDFEKAAETFRILGHETRLRLLVLMLQGERSVGEIETLSGIAQPGLSQQLAILRKAALVTTRRDAKQVFYSLDPDGLKAVVGLIDRLKGRVGDMPKPKGHKRKVAGGSAAMFAKIL